LKEILLDEFFALGGNYKNHDKAKALLNKIDKYLEKLEEKDRQLSYVKILLKVYEEEFNFHDFGEACRLASPVVQSLLHITISEWDFYDLRFGQVALTWTKSFEEGEELLKRILVMLNKYIDNEPKPTYKIRLFSHMNMITRLLKADFMEIDAGRELNRSVNLERVFKDSFDSAFAICECKGEELKKYKFVLLIRNSLFDRDYESVDLYLSELKKIVDKEFYKAMVDSIMPYMPYAGFFITEKQLKIMVGSKLREFRERAGLTAEDIGKVLGYKIAHITAIERGERGLSLYQIHKIAHRYGVTIDMFCNDTKENKIISKIEVAFEKLKMKATGLNEHELETLSIMADRMKVQQRVIKKMPYLISSIENNNDDPEE
jgi:transcriptional regulator with XRE-family HTH domain